MYFDCMFYLLGAEAYLGYFKVIIFYAIHVFKHFGLTRKCITSNYDVLRTYYMCMEKIVNIYSIYRFHLFVANDNFSEQISNSLIVC